MKILHVITLAELGGAQSVVINLAEKSLQEGHQVFVASSAHGEMWEILHPEIHQIKIKNLKHPIGFKDFLVFKELFGLYKKIKPEIIHLHSSKMGILGRLVFPASKIIYTIHGFDSIRIRYRKFLPLEKILQAKCKAIVAVSRYDIHNLKKEGIFRNVHLIENGIKDCAGKILKDESDLFSEFKKDNDTKVILSISRLAPPKRFDIFCDLAKKFTDKNIIFVWIGNKTEEKSVPGNVILMGEKKNACQYYMFADLAVLFSDYEGLPMSLIEALCFSKPIIASDVGGISELIDRNGFLILNNDLQKIGKTIDFILNNQNNYKTFALHSRKIFEERFNVNVMYNKYKELYSSATVK